jgi:multidrug efflux pump subunit AcrA (membrane-fusion protein)
MDQPQEANILPGMTAKVTASGGDGNTMGSTIYIPAIAVLNDADGQNYVWLFERESKTVKKIPVSLGTLEGTKNVTITEGLQGGEEIVVAGVNMLQDGMTVRPWESQREGK